MNQILICDIEPKYFLNFTMETLSNKYLLSASKILGSENSDIKLNSNSDSNEVLILPSPINGPEFLDMNWCSNGKTTIEWF
jgi:hypothetical protein